MCEECAFLRMEITVAWLSRDWNEMWRLIRMKEEHDQVHDLWKELWPAFRIY